MSKKIVIIGAGPAGLSCAIELAKAGKDVLVLDQWGPGQIDHDGHTKLCGGSLVPRAQKFLRPLKSEVVENRDAVVKMGKYSADLHFDYSSANAVNRADLAKELTERTQSAGAAIRFNTRVKSIDLEKKQIELENELIHYDVVVGADGFFSIVRKAVQKQGIIPKDTDFGQAVEYEVPRESTSKQLFTVDMHPLFSGGYAWIIPHKDTYYIGAGESNATRSKKKNSLYDDLLTWAAEQKLPANPEKIRGWFLPYQYKGHAFPHNVYLIGDAAGLMDSLTGEGISPAYISGYEIAHLIINPSYEPKNLHALLRTKRRVEIMFYLGQKLPFARKMIFGLLIFLSRRPATLPISATLFNVQKLG